MLRPMTLLMLVVLALPGLATGQAPPASNIKPESGSLQAPFSFVSIVELIGGAKETAIPLSRQLEQRKGDRVRPLLVDAESLIQINFDRAEVRSHEYFRTGRLSLEAQLNDRQVEVEGYSEVGKERTTVGGTGMEPQRFVDAIKAFQTQLLNVTPQLAANPSPDHVANAADLILTLLKEFQADPSSAAAFSRALGISQSIVEQRHNRLRASLERLRKLMADQSCCDLTEKKAAALEGLIVELLAFTGEITDGILRECGEIEGSELSGKAYQFQSMLRGAAREEATLSPEELRVCSNTYWSAARRERAIEEIYRNLVPGRISLSREGAKRGDVLRIYLRFLPIHRPPGDDKERPVRFTLAELRIEEFGWHRSVIDSFLLVKRVDESKASTGGASSSEGSQDDSEPANTISPSNFKGAAGASLIWRNRKRPEEKGWFSRLFDVSIGINVSYLDFDTGKDIEIGAGPVFGFADDQIVLTAGWNLNAENKRFYWALGFSFAKLKEKMTPKKE